MNKPAKPLNMKAYGSTPHLPGSRVGPGDWHIDDGQARILTVRPRDRRDRIIVTEKLDGSCVAAANIDGNVVPLIRAGYHAKDSPHPMHHLFADWVEARRDQFLRALKPGERAAGEWLAQAHGTRYALPSENDLFACFAILNGKRRLPHDETRARIASAGLRGAHVISDGPPLPQTAAMELLGEHGFHGALDPVEGAVWVCERDGEFDFIAKHVRPEKIDGAFLASVSGQTEIWNEVGGRRFAPAEN